MRSHYIQWFQWIDFTLVISVEQFRLQGPTMQESGGLVIISRILMVMWRWGCSVNGRGKRHIRKLQIIQSFLYPLILAAWSTAWEMLLQERRWRLWCSDAGVNGSDSDSSSHLLSGPWNLCTCMFFIWAQVSSSWTKSKRAALIQSLVFCSDCASFYPKVQEGLSAALVLSREASISGEVIYGK